MELPHLSMAVSGIWKMGEKGWGEQLAFMDMGTVKSYSLPSACQRPRKILDVVPRQGSSAESEALKALQYAEAVKYCMKNPVGREEGWKSSGCDRSIVSSEKTRPVELLTTDKTVEPAQEVALRIFPP